MINALARRYVRASIAWWTFDRLLTLLTFLAIAAAAFLMPAQNDTWWHLKAGEDIWRQRHVALRDDFSFTVNGGFWPNHEWLSQLLFFAAYSVGGLPLLTAACAIAIVGAWLVSWRLMQGSPRMKCLLVAGVLASATPTWTLRPQAISLLMVAATVALLTARNYRWLPLLFLVWANMHGAVLTGLLLLAAALGAVLVEKPSAFPRLAAIAALCVVSTVATPLGLRFWSEIPEFFIRVRSVPIDEFAAPRLTATLWTPFWCTVVALVALAAAQGRSLLSSDESRHRGDLTICACALALLAPAVTAVRNTAPFLLIAAPAVSILIVRRNAARKASAALERRAAAGHPTTERAGLNWALAAGASTGLIAVVAYSYTNGIDRLQWRPLPDAALTAAAACRGNLYNRFDEGGYLIWFLRDRKVFIDSRFFPYPDDLLQEHIRMERTGDSAETFHRYDIRCAFLPADSRLAQRLIDDEWERLYRDERWQVLRDASARRSTSTAVVPSASPFRAVPSAIARAPEGETSPALAILSPARPRQEAGTVHR